MANYDNLPVFKAAYDLLLRVYGLGKHWSKEVKYTLGEEMKKELCRVMVLVYRANSVRDKAGFIAQARESVVVVKLQLRLLSDLKQLTLKQYAHLCEAIESISKQLAAWEKAQETEETNIEKQKEGTVDKIGVRQRQGAPERIL